MIFRRILVATDFSDCAARALDLGVELTQKFGSELTLIHAWEFPTYAASSAQYFPADFVSPLQKAAEHELAGALQALQARVPNANSVLRMGSPWQEIVDAAAELHADLIVIGTHGRRGLSHAFLGSVAERVVRLSAVPVLTVHGPAKPPPGV